MRRRRRSEASFDDFKAVNPVYFDKSSGNVATESYISSIVLFDDDSYSWQQRRREKPVKTMILTLIVFCGCVSFIIYLIMQPGGLSNYSMKTDTKHSTRDRDDWKLPKLFPYPNNTYAVDLETCRQCCADVNNRYDGNLLNGNVAPDYDLFHYHTCVEVGCFAYQFNCVDIVAYVNNGGKEHPRGNSARGCAIGQSIRETGLFVFKPPEQVALADPELQPKLHYEFACEEDGTVAVERAVRPTPTFPPLLWPHPTNYPTSFPSVFTSEQPTTADTAFPTRRPSVSPTGYPQVQPTTSKTPFPSEFPTKAPTAAVETEYPTVFPTESPTNALETEFPTEKPTESPTATLETEFPTEKPTVAPTDVMETEFPTAKPTGAPSKLPTSISPTPFPTDTPTKKPVDAETESPTRSPEEPTSEPKTNSPTGEPTVTETREPTSEPTENPVSSSPTSTPTRNPAALPTRSPTTRSPSSSPLPAGETVTPTKSPTLRVGEFTPTSAPQRQEPAEPEEASLVEVENLAWIGGASGFGSSTIVAGLLNFRMIF